MRKATTAAILAILLMLGNSPPELLAQEKPGDKLSVEVDRVRVDALVLHKGKPILGLTKDDFEIHEDGVLQEIKYLYGPFPLSAVIVVDQSGSLENFFAGVKKTAKSVLDTLPPGDEIAVVGFDNEIGISTNFTFDREKISAILSEISNTKGGTDIIKALRHSIEKLKVVRNSRRKVILFISDNYNVNAVSVAEKKQLGESMARNEVVLYNIKVGVAIPTIGPASPGSGEELVRLLVRQNGGQTIDARGGNFPKAFARAVERLKHTYSLFYVPQDLEKSGIRKVGVELKNNPRSKWPPFQKKFDVIARKEYYLKK